jgi:hypothetical protein
MTTPSERFVPKVHPATRPAEPEDPWTLHATPVAGDPEVMLECLVQEYAWMGWDVEQILTLFRDPSYPALHALWRGCGEEGLRRRIAGVLRRMGVFRFRSVVCDEPEPAEPELIELGVPPSWRSEENSHAHRE